MAFLEKVSDVQKLLNTLSWLKLAQLTVLVLVLALAWATYDNRESIYRAASQTRLSKAASLRLTKLSKDTIAEIDLVVQRSELVVGIQIEVVNFQKNTKTVLYVNIDNSDLKAVYTKYLSSTISEVPLFNNDTVNNKRLIDLINGDFVCNPYSETLSARLYGDTAKYVDTVCMNAIPPYYGRFLGTISIYTQKLPLPEELDQLRALAKELSLLIYERDIK